MIWGSGCGISFLVWILEKLFSRKNIKINPRISTFWDKIRLTLFTLLVITAIIVSGFSLYVYNVKFLEKRQAELRAQAHWDFR